VHSLISMFISISAVLALASCSRPAPTKPVAATPTQAMPADEVPAPDDALRRWQAIVADEFRVPAGMTAAALVPELVAYLGSPDPVRRDGIGYEVLATWIDKRVLSPADVAALAQQLLPGLQDASVFRRSFSILVLAAVVRRDAQEAALTDELRRAILTAAHDHAQREADLRGHIGAQGWVHASAHSADLHAQLAKLALFTDADRATMLDSIAGFAVRRHAAILHHGEDARFAVAVIAAIKRGVTKPALEAWLEKIIEPLKAKPSPAFDLPKYAAQRNARNLLFSLFVQVSLTKDPTPGELMLLESLRTVLAG
jgi:hypothetical protein